MHRVYHRSAAGSAAALAALALAGYLDNTVVYAGL